MPHISDKRLRVSQISGAHVFASTALCVSITALLVITGDNLLHWCVIPITLCGIITGYSVLRWFSSGVHSFDPNAITSFVFFNGFYISPLMQLENEFYPYLHLDDWPKWFGVWACFQVAGLLVYYYSFFIFSGRSDGGLGFRRFRKDSFYAIGVILIVISLVMLVRIYYVLGGMGGILQEYDARTAVGVVNYNPFEGLGIEFALANVLPVFAPAFFLVYAKGKRIGKSALFLYLYIVAAVLLAVVCGAAFGNRARIIYPIFIAIASYHFMIRPLTKRWVVLGAVGAILLMNGYYWYKMGGLTGLEALFSEDAREEIRQRKSIGDERLFIMARDFSRADTQSLLLQRSFEGSVDYAYGRTYIGGILAVIPRSVFPGRPDTVVKEKTHTIYGTISNRTMTETTLLVGLFGEVLLNFGPWVAIFSYIIPGFFLGLAVRYIDGLDGGDARRILLGQMCLLPLMISFNDSNVIVMFFAMYFLAPALVVIVASRRSRDGLPKPRGVQEARAVPRRGGGAGSRQQAIGRL